jgi:hypothetical protein
MNPLKALSNVQKARLLHALFYAEIPAFLKFVDTQCHIIADSKDEIIGNWKNQLISAHMWLGLAEETQRVIGKCGKGLHKSSAVFSDQLFAGYGAVFMSQQLFLYTENNPIDPKFKTAVDLFFNP